MARRCTSLSLRTGEPCRAWARPGGVSCRWHAEHGENIPDPVAAIVTDAGADEGLRAVLDEVIRAHDERVLRAVAESHTRLMSRLGFSSRSRSPVL